MKKAILILSVAVLAIFIGTTYPLIALGQIATNSNGDPKCEGLTGAAYGLCTAAIALGCGNPGNTNLGCAQVEKIFERITGQTPPWTSEGCFDNLDCGGGGFFDPFCAKSQGRCEERGICQARPDTCIIDPEPVCGCDGVTYTNECIANASGVSVDYPGECR